MIVEGLHMWDLALDGLETFETGTRNGQQTIPGLISIESDVTGFLV